MTATYKEGDKLYVVVRNDLPPGVQLAQAIHAKDEFAMQFPDINKAWYEQSNYICVLQVENEETLDALMDKAWYSNIKYSCFSESDRNGEHTAAAFEPGEAAKELCKDLQLALK